ncbi:hypothetical protein [Psychroserpens sp. MEBiC05023]
MKKNLLFIGILMLLFGCSSDSDESGECGVVTLTGVTQDGSTLIFTYQAQTTFNYYEIGYDQTASINNGGQGELFFNDRFTTTDMSTTSIDDDDLNFYAENNQTLSFYIRAQCENGDLTSWQGPIVLQVQEYCEKPYDLNASGSGPGFYWDYYYNNGDASYFQVEYGLQGFTLGTGTQITTNDEYTFDAMMAQGNTYDFYVRALCENNLGFSGWAGPVSAYAEEDYNLCSPPSNVLSQIEYNFFGDPVGVLFQWDLNGETSFEHVLVPDGANPDTGSINTSDGSGWPLYNQGIFLNTPYDFYIRAVCIDGSRTEWVGPKNVYISG